MPESFTPRLDDEARAELRAEADELARDPDDLAEAARVLTDMRTLRASRLVLEL